MALKRRTKVENVLANMKCNTRKIDGDRTLDDDHQGMLTETSDIYVQSPKWQAPDGPVGATRVPRHKGDQQMPIL